MKPTIDHFDKLVKRNPNNFIFLCVSAGHACSAITRILIGHQELYHSFDNLKQRDYDDPLRYPDSTEGFEIHIDHPLSIKEQHIGCVHFYFHTPWFESDLTPYFKLVKENKIIVIMKHDTSVAEEFKESRCIFVVGKSIDRALTMNIKQKIFPNNDLKNVYNLNLNNLFSYDYDTFLEEYLKLVWKFKLTARVNSVRSFILMWLDRQERLKKSLS